jgi:DNA-binding transcriptional LysR family regulator
MDFDLRLLRHARALAEEGSFARAARTLHLTQPALSRSIQELERRTGIKLFDRNRGRVEPTDLGRVFLGHARDLLSRAEALDREVTAMRGSGTGSLVVGSGTFPTTAFMADALAAFLRRNPGVGVRIVNDNWTVLVAALRRRELDFIVAAPPATEESAGIATRLLSPRQGYFLVRPGHPLLSCSPLSLADIAACPIICTSRLSAGVAECLREARKGRGAGRPLPDVACEDNEMMRRIAGATDHVLLAPLASNAHAIAAGDLVVLPCVDPRIGVTFAVLRLEARTLPPIADELIREVIAADRAALDVERVLAARLVASPSGRPAPRRPARRRAAVAVAAAR